MKGRQLLIKAAMAVMSTSYQEDDPYRNKFQEIMKVRVTDAIDNDRPLLGGKDESFYAAFHNPHVGADGDDEESLLLKKVGTSNRQWEASVNLHIPVDTPLQADVYRKMFGRPDRLIGSVIFEQDRLDTAPKTSTIDGILLDRNKKPTRTVVELDLKQKNWKDVYVRKEDEEEEEQGGLQGES
jgi:hypothetical protein